MGKFTDRTGTDCTAIALKVEVVVRRGELAQLASSTRPKSRYRS